MTTPPTAQPAQQPLTTIGGKIFSPTGEAELRHVIANVTQSVGTLAAIIATQKGADAVSNKHVELAAEELELVTPPLRRQIAETATVFLAGCAISTLVQFVDAGQDISKLAWVCLVVAAFLLLPTATALWLKNRQR